MPIRAEVDGVGVLEFPDGTDPAVIQATVKRMVTTNANWSKNNPVAGAARGARDIVDAGAQLAVRGANAFGLAPDSEVQRVEQINADAEKQYQQGRGPGAGFDISRAVGNAALGAVASPIRVTAAASMPMRALRAGGAGAFAGASQPVQDAGDNADFFKKKAAQTGIGAVTGAVAQPLMELGTEFAGKGVQYLANRAVGGVKALAGEAGDAAAERIVREALGKQGVDFNALGAQVKSSLIDDVKVAMRKYGGVSASALQRKADFGELGIDPLQSWVTRDPNQWGRESNLAGIAGVGDDLVNRRNQLDRAVVGKLNALRGSGGDAYESGVAAEQGLKQFDERKRQGVTAAYQAARQSAGAQNEVNLAGLSQDYADVLRRFRDKIPSGVRGNFEDLGLLTGKQSRVVTVEDADAILKNINAHYGADKATNTALDELSRAVKSAVTSGGDDAFSPARKLAAERFSVHDAVPALRDVAKGSFAPEDFFQKYVLGGDVREVASMWARIDSPDVKQAARAQLLDYMKRSAIGPASDEAGVVSQAGISKAMEAPGMKQKLRIILGDSGLRELETIQRAAEAAIKIPGGAKPNTSNTSQAIANLLLKTTGVPVLGPMVSQPLRQLGQQRGVSAAQQVGPDAIGQGLLWNDELARRSQAIAGLLGYGTTAGLLGDLSR